MSSIELVGGWPSVITQLVAGEHLSSADAEVAMTAILRGEAQPSQIAAFVVALRAKACLPQ
jgi:anthranilate phosphoribosyltransferase